jgi:hypothetical protein
LLWTFCLRHSDHSGALDSPPGRLNPEDRCGAMYNIVDDPERVARGISNCLAAPARRFAD